MLVDTCTYIYDWPRNHSIDGIHHSLDAVGGDTLRMQAVLLDAFGAIFAGAVREHGGRLICREERVRQENSDFCSRALEAMFRLSRRNSQMSTKDEGCVVEQHQSLLDNDQEDAASDLSDSEQFLTRGAFLLTPATELQMERIGLICEKMNYKGPFSLTKTATGILFKFAETEDYQLTFKKGFHKVTGSRFYKKIPIPCRPQKTFAIFAFEIPDDVPEEDIRHSLYKFRTVVEVCRLPCSPTSATIASSSSSPGPKGGATSTEISCISSSGYVTTSSTPGSAVCSPVRIIFASLDECNTLLRDGLDFYGATFFPTEPALSTRIAQVDGKKTVTHNSRLLDLMSTSGVRVRDILPMFDCSSNSAFSKIPTPVTKTIVHNR